MEADEWVNYEANRKFSRLTDRETHIFGHHHMSVLGIGRYDFQIDGRKA